MGENKRGRLDSELQKIGLRLQQFKNLGYDVEESRKYILRCAGTLVPEILELGTGKGHLAMAIAKTGNSLLSLDRDPEILKVASARVAFLGFSDRIKFIAGDAEKLAFPDKRFSTLICADLWHHLSDHDKTIEEMIRVWDKRGPLVIADMSRQGLDVVAQVHSAEGGFHNEGPVNINLAGEYLLKRGLKFKRFEGYCQVVYVVNVLTA